jgi:hypothetical protein
MKIINKPPINVNNLEIVICCGKGLGPRGEVDWVLSSRIDLSIEVVKNNLNSALLLSGGIGLTSDLNQKQINEADAMEAYIKLNYPDFTSMIIKENYLLKNNHTKLAIISDELHIKRISTLFDAVLGDNYEVYYLGSKISLYGKYRQLLEEYENTNLQGALELVKLIERGNHTKFMEFDKAYRDLRKLRLEQGESRLDYISPKQVLEFMNDMR